MQGPLVQVDLYRSSLQVRPDILADTVVPGHRHQLRLEVLAKDARMKPESFKAMYPRFKEWLEIKQEVDPDWLFSSDLSRRLQMEK